MNAERATVLAVALLMLLVGAVAWMFQLRPPLQVDASPLASLPSRLDVSGRHWLGGLQPGERRWSSSGGADAAFRRAGSLHDRHDGL